MNKQDLKKLKQQRQQRETRRRLAMYGALGLLVAFLTTGIVLLTEGYYFSPKNKQVIQNGLVLVDSNPRNARVVINGREEKDRTQSRFTLPSGQYDFTVWKTNYRDWKRSFALGGSEVVDLNYILMIPRAIPARTVSQYEKPLTMMSESLDRHWLLVRQASVSQSIDLVDTTLKDPVATKINLPPAQFLPTTNFESLKVVQWASDNQHVLLQATIADKPHFIVLNRTEPTVAVDLGVEFNTDLNDVRLRDGHWDKYFALDANRDLREIDLNARTMSAPRFQHVARFMPFGADKLVLVQEEEGTNRANVVLVDKPGKMLVTSLTSQLATGYLLDIAEYDGNWYVAIGSQQDKVVNIYKNTFDTIKQHSATPPRPFVKLDTANPQAVSFSAGGQYVAVQDAGKFVVFDSEFQRTYRYDTALPLVIESNQHVTWLDNNHILSNAGDQQYIIDQDGANLQGIGAARPLAPVTFDKNNEFYFAIVPGKDGQGDSLIRYSLNVEPGATN